MPKERLGSGNWRARGEKGDRQNTFGVMRHSFRFPEHVREAVQEHVAEAIEGLSPDRYSQEVPYTAALAGRLEGTAYEGSDGFVVFESTIVDDRGRGAAESWAGADWVITARISDGKTTVSKAILIQSKRGRIEDLPPDELSRLRSQIKDMKRLTRSPKVMETVEYNGVRIPRIVSANRILDGQRYHGYELGAYMTRRVLPTHDGDTRPDFIRGVRDSSLTEIRVLAETRR